MGIIRKIQPTDSWKHFVKKEAKENDVNQVRVRKDITAKRMSQLEKEWLDDPRMLSFNDWAYIFHNIFLYEVPESKQKQFDVDLRYYLATTSSLPHHKDYKHFALYLKNAGFRLDGLDHVIAIYSEYSKNTPEDTPEEKEQEQEFESNSVVMTTMGDTPSDRWREIEEEWKNSQYHTIYTVYDYAFCKYNIVAMSHGGRAVKLYNTSTYSHEDSGNFLTFPMYMKTIDKATKIKTSSLSFFGTWDDLDHEYRKHLFKDEEVPKRTLAKAKDTTRETKVEKKKRMPLEDLDLLIEVIAIDVEQGGHPLDKMRLEMAQKYRERRIAMQ